MEQSYVVREPRSQSLVGREVVDMDGTSVGQIEEVYISDMSGNSGWAAVATGVAGKKLLAVPLAHAALEEKVTVPYPKELIDEAPELSGGELLRDEELSAYRHYNLRRETGSDYQQHAELADPPPEPKAPLESMADPAYENYNESGRKQVD